jgi:hypothetical protein
VQHFQRVYQQNWLHLITKNTGYWLPKLPFLAQKVYVKIRSLAEDKGFIVGQNPINIYGFIDNTCFKSCRPLIAKIEKKEKIL